MVLLSELDLLRSQCNLGYEWHFCALTPFSPVEFKYENFILNTMKWRFRAWFRKHRLLVIVVAVALGMLLIAFGAKIALFVNFILGNDTVVKLSTDKEALSLVHGQMKKITFEASVTTNPFCQASCASSFIDISSGAIIEQDRFVLRPTVPFHKEYEIRATRLGNGQDLYRFDLECRSVRTLLCHTDEEPTTRSILLTVEYNLTQEEKILKENLKKEVEGLVERLGMLEGRLRVLEDAAIDLNNVSVAGTVMLELITTKNALAHDWTLIEGLRDIWQKQDYARLADETGRAGSIVNETEEHLSVLNESVMGQVLVYNGLVRGVEETRQWLNELDGMMFTNETRAREINETVTAFHNVAGFVQQRQPLEEMSMEVERIRNRTIMILFSTRQEVRKEVLQRALEADIAYDTLCEVTGVCIEHPTIEKRGEEQAFDLNATCAMVDELRVVHAALNTSLQNASLNESYPDTDAFRMNISRKIVNVKQNISLQYLANLSTNASNSALIMELLVKLPIVETEDYPPHNLTPALGLELVRQQPESCPVVNVSIEEIDRVELPLIEVEESVPVLSSIVFSEPLPQCCVFGECRACCVNEGCRNDPTTFPVVFLHGHSVNKDVSAEYSLEGFNKIQKKLEEDGFLNAGTITLFTPRDVPGLWGLPDVPLTIRASYYFDIFKTPENYIAVQAKSENIDTYAIRLKELVETIQYKTGKPKVVLVAFSMGGLVARRYIQIFGTEHVDKLIMIGTPNVGIVGQVADFCPLVGEKLECRDMHADSLFMNKLNRDKLPAIPIVNIVGTGCAMDGAEGDGAVLEENALLAGAENHVINGTCRSTVKPLHLELRDIDLYPEVYEIVRDALRK